MTRLAAGSRQQQQQKWTVMAPTSVRARPEEESLLLLPVILPLS